MSQLSNFDDRAMPEQWRLRSPCVVEDLANCFVVRARGGQQLAYIYYEDDPRRRSIVKVLSRDEARRIAAAIAKLPEVTRNLPGSGTRSLPLDLGAQRQDAGVEVQGR